MLCAGLSNALYGTKFYLLFAYVGFTLHKTDTPPKEKRA
jgi:hypothetical protein